MPVYLIRAGDTEMVKIGWADSDVEGRRRDLQCAHYEELRIVRVIETFRGGEGYLHRFFHAHRVRGEWFRFQPEMLTIIPEATTDTPLGRALAAVGGTGRLAELLSIQAPSIYSWKQVPALRVLAIERATGVSRHELRPDLYPLEAAA